MNFYNQTRWRRKRLVMLKRDDYECRECARYGRVSKATHVHHILPLAICLTVDPLLAWAGYNLTSLCTSCHEAMHDRTYDKLTDKGRRLVQRVPELEQYRALIA